MSEQVENFCAGVAQIDMNARPELDLSGYAMRNNPATGMHDAIFTRALALRDPNTLLLMLTVDALGFESTFVEMARERIEKRLRECCSALLGERWLSIMISATHTHSAPATMTLHGCGKVDENWLCHCAEVLEEAAQQAVSTLQPARFGCGSGVVENVAINRRDKSWLQKSTDLPATLPVDTELGLWRLETVSGAPLACVLNFACHPVVMDADSSEISAEYPGVACEKLREELGAVTLFFTGACGDINPARRGSWDDVEWAASQIAHEAARVWTRTELGDSKTLQAVAQQMRLPLLPLTEGDELQKLQSQYEQDQREAQQKGDAVAASIAAVFLDWSKKVLQLTQSTPDQSVLGHDVEVQLFRVGDAVLVGLPGEIFVALGLQIKKQLHELGFKSVLIDSYANGNPGYFPTRDAYARGGYEVEWAHRFYGHPACAAPEAGENLVAQSELLGRDLIS